MTTPANPTPEPDGSDGHDCGNPVRITTRFGDMERTNCGCGYMVAEWPYEEPFDRLRRIEKEHATLTADLSDTRRRLAEVEKENAAWREYYIAGVLLDDIDYTQPEHDAAIKRVVKAIEALTPMSDGTLSRELDSARQWTEREQKEREAHWDQLTALRNAADGMRLLAVEMRRLLLAAVETCKGPIFNEEVRSALDRLYELDTAYAALISEGNQPISDSNSPTDSRESQG